MRLVLLLLSICACVSCGNPLPTLENFDSAVWKDDRNGCKGSRREMAASLEQQKGKLLALKEMQIVSLLGRPDGNELYERNQKFYYYNLTAGTACASQDPTRLKLEVRFNAMGVAKEVYIR